MSKDKKELKDKLNQAKKMYLDKFNFNGSFITIDYASKLLKRMS